MFTHPSEDTEKEYINYLNKHLHTTQQRIKKYGIYKIRIKNI